MDTVVVFKIDEQVMALPVNRVERVIWAVDITTLPGQADHMLGVIDVEGQTMPVVNIRHLLGLSPRDLDLDDHIVIIELNNKFAAFIVDKVEGVVHFEAEDFSDLDRAKGDGVSAGLLKKEGTLIVVLSTEALIDMANKRRTNIPEPALTASRV